MLPSLLVSPLFAALGIPHGFNLRTGGASAPPYESMNLGRSVGDEPEAVADNHARFARAIGFPPGALFTASQVHGAGARTIEQNDEPARARSHEADVLIAGPIGIAVGVSVADCAAVLIADRATGAVAAVHAGWRGVVLRAVAVGARGVLDAGGASSPRDLHAAIFPHIRACCFEVGEEVAEPLHAAATAAGAGGAIDRTRAKPHVDLAAIIRAQLKELGVTSERVDDVPGCTRCEPERFFSFRRDGKRSGRHIAAVVSFG